MLAFAICLVFNAHPDFWLPAAEFDEQNDDLASLSFYVRRYEVMMEHYQERIAATQSPVAAQEFADKLATIQAKSVDVFLRLGELRSLLRLESLLTPEYYKDNPRRKTKPTRPSF